MIHLSAKENAILRVAVVAPVIAPVYGLFDYLPPVDLPAPLLERGMRLWVPFKDSKRLGFFWEYSDVPTCDPSLLKPILQSLDIAPLFSIEDLDLLAWTAGYYQYPLGEVLAAALPKRLREGDEVIKKTRKYNKKSQITEFNTVELEDTNISKLTLDQTETVATIIATLTQFQVFVLDEEIYNNKIKIYLALIKQALVEDGQILVLVPEINSILHIVNVFNKYLSIPIAIFRAGQTELQREHSWQAAKSGTARVIIGTRSTVFAPLPKLVLIIVDNEHNQEFKSQHDGFRFSARDVAVWRAKQRDCPIVLASATPSLETLHNLAIKRYSQLNFFKQLKRLNNLHFDLIDVRTTHLKAGLSPAILRLLKDNLKLGQQSLLFLNRRGYAHLFICYACGWIARCINCDARLTLHSKAQILWCHHCGAQQMQYQACPACQHTELKGIGQGTERLESFLMENFGDIALLRIDSDNISKPNTIRHQLQNNTAAQPAIIIGTQLLTKDYYQFPNVTLVGILNFDQGLYGADYRAAERMAQLMIQTASQAGRADKQVQVVIQTRHPDHPLLQALIHKGYREFANLVLQERNEAQLPPFSAQALLCSESEVAVKAQNFLEAAVSLATNFSNDVQLLGPVPEVMEKKAGKHRFRLLLQSHSRLILQEFLSILVPQLYKLSNYKVRWYLDVDPQEL